MTSNKGIHSDPKSRMAFGPGYARRSETNKMDKWLLHTDVKKRLKDYYSKPDILMPVYSKIESVVEKECYILLPLKSKVIKSCFNEPEFNGELRQSEKPLTRDTPRGREFSRRIHNRFSIFPDATAGRFRYFRKTTQEDIAIKRYEFSEGREVLELRLRKEIVLEDLRKLSRKGLFCFEIFRFSEKTLQDLGLREEDKIEKGDYYVYRRTLIHYAGSRFRMNSVSLMMGKMLIESS